MSGPQGDRWTQLAAVLIRLGFAVPLFALAAVILGAAILWITGNAADISGEIRYVAQVVAVVLMVAGAVPVVWFLIRFARPITPPDQSSD